MYAINGSTKDSNYGIMGSISWSMEISYSKQPPASDIMMYYNRNYPSMIAMIEYSGYGLDGTITDINTGNPIAGVVFVNDYFPTFSDGTAGDYHKYVLPGTYSITVVANGYETQTVDNIVDWVLVELRDATSASNATEATVISYQAGFLLYNGAVVGIDGSSPLFFGEAVSLGLFAVIYTRNHLAVLSASELTGGGGMYSYDFSTGSGQVYGGALGYSNLGDGKWGMASSDGNCDGAVTLLDEAPEWEQQTGEAGYVT